MKSFWRVVQRYVRAFLPSLYESKLFPWKDFPTPSFPIQRKYGLWSWVTGRIKPQTFPYHDTTEAAESADKMFDVIRWDLNRLADQAFACRDYRAHAIYSQAANRLVHLQHAERDLKMVKRGKQ